MVRTYKKKIFSVIVTLAMIFSLLGGMALPATVSAEPGSYEVTISATNATFSVTGQSTPPYYSDANGVIEITVEGSGAYVYPVVKVTSGNAKTVCVTRTAANTYTISNVEDVTDVEIYGCVDISTSGSYNITGGGYYYIGAGVTTARTITVSTTSPVHLKGGVIDKDTLGSANTNTSITCVAGAQLGIEDIFIASPNSGGNVINFTGTGNKLFIHGTSILESTNFGNGAVIHVGLTNATVLAIEGYNKCAALYIYKSSGSAAIGGNSGESCGELTFESGNIFIKGSQVGAVIGGDSGSTTNDDITIKGGCLNIVAVARGAAIGGSNQTGGGNVYLEGGNVTITCDWQGPAIGHGASGSAKGGGNLCITGGSLLIALTDNTPLTPATAINATISDCNSNNLVPLVYTPASPTANTDVEVNSSPFYNGPVNPYVYVGGSVTIGNWSVTNPNSSLYLYVPTSTTSVDIDSNPVNVYDATFTFNSATARLFVDRYQPAGPVLATGMLDFTVKPFIGYGVSSVTATNGTITDNGNDNYTLSGVTASTTVTVTTAPSYAVTFSATNGTVYVNDQAVSSSSITSSSTLDFLVVPNIGYEVTGVAASNGTVTPNADGSYTLSGVTATNTVTATIASDTDAWVNNANTAWYNPPQSTYTLTTPAQLAGLASLVNAGTDDFAGVTISLGGSIDLLGYEWTPIGGASVFSSGVPTGNSFTGTFDGAGFTVSNLSIERLVPGTGAYGLFGHVDGVDISNLTVNGAIITAADVDAVGGIVGYTTGNITNCHNETDITVNNNSASQAGGVAGVVENASGTGSISVTESSNLGTIQGRARVGGIVGALYASVGGDASITLSFNGGDVETLDTAGNGYVGGIVGYCRGDVVSCYNADTAIISTNGARYIAGIAGILNGAAAPCASMTDCYNAGSFSGTTDNDSIQALWANSDNSMNVVISNCVYLDTLDQDIDLTHRTLADYTNVNAVTSGELADDGFIFEPDYLDPGVYTLDGGYPIFWWQL